MLWLALKLPQLPLEVFQPPAEQASVILERKGNRRWVIAVSAAAAQQGIAPGLDAVALQARVPELKLIDRSSVLERGALKALAGWAYQFSSTLSFDAGRQLLWLEIGSSLKYFGGLERLIPRITQGLQVLGYTVQTGIAPTPEAAALLAADPKSRPIPEGEDIRQRINKLPLTLLSIPDSVKEDLLACGLRSIGQIYAIAPDALARRFGLEDLAYLRRLLGESPHLLRPFRLPDTYQRRYEFLDGIDNSQALLFPLRRLLIELQGYLRARDTGVQSFQIELEHEHVPATVFEVRSTQPQRDANQMHLLLREHLERLQMPEPAAGIVIRADRFASLGDTQQDFFDTGKRQDQEWASLLDKLKARLGSESIRMLGLHADHRPEKAWCIAQDQTQSGEILVPERPLWLLSSPRPIAGLPLLTKTPERIEDGWWEGADVQRDYYTAVTRDGSRLWIYREAENPQWYLHGVWA